MIRLFVAHLLAGADLHLETNKILTIEGKTITSILPGTADSADVVLPSSVTLLPGLIDCHSHLALDARIPGHLDMMDDAESVQTLRALRAIKDDLYHGITGLRCMGDRYYLDIVLRDSATCEDIIAPWMQVSGIGMKGIHGHGYVGRAFSGVEEFRKQARENLHHGVDWLKIFVTSGTPSEHIDWYLSREEIRAVIDEAYSCGIKTSAHCIGGQGLQYCVEEGISVLDHCYWVDEHNIELIMKSNSTVCFTPGIFMDDLRLPMCPAAHVEKVKYYRAEVEKRLSRLVAAKPRFVVGSDANHGLLWKDVNYMVQLGMSEKEAIKGVTVYAAHLMERKTGQLTSGYDADMIAVDDNPLKNVACLEHVRFVCKGGRIIRCDFSTTSSDRCAGEI
ncbi:MAG: amidohydrolase family protein [Spirochaetia bacterium]|jgi:imidazolonepropionase-like amidohydrolase|nr:amidohydrolase family protein [Spirochaetia bacterium]